MTATQKRTLRDVRIDAGFRTQAALARAASLARSTVWLAEEGRPISYVTARVIVNTLKQRGMNVEVSDLDWSVID